MHRRTDFLLTAGSSRHAVLNSCVSRLHVSHSVHLRQPACFLARSAHNSSKDRSLKIFSCRVIAPLRVITLVMLADRLSIGKYNAVSKSPRTCGNFTSEIMRPRFRAQFYPSLVVNKVAHVRAMELCDCANSALRKYNEAAAPPQSPKRLKREVWRKK
jgi:hypothetical protein